MSFYGNLVTENNIYDYIDNYILSEESLFNEFIDENNVINESLDIKNILLKIKQYIIDIATKIKKWFKRIISKLKNNFNKSIVNKKFNESMKILKSLKNKKSFKEDYDFSDLLSNDPPQYQYTDDNKIYFKYFSSIKIGNTIFGKDEIKDGLFQYLNSSVQYFRNYKLFFSNISHLYLQDIGKDKYANDYHTYDDYKQMLSDEINKIPFMDYKIEFGKLEEEIDYIADPDLYTTSEQIAQYVDDYYNKYYDELLKTENELNKLDQDPVKIVSDIINNYTRAKLDQDEISMNISNIVKDAVSQEAMSYEFHIKNLVYVTSNLKKWMDYFNIYVMELAKNNYNT